MFFTLNFFAVHHVLVLKQVILTM